MYFLAPSDQVELFSNEISSTTVASEFSRKNYLFIAVSFELLVYTDLCRESIAVEDIEFYTTVPSQTTNTIEEEGNYLS